MEFLLIDNMCPQNNLVICTGQIVNAAEYKWAISDIVLFVCVHGQFLRFLSSSGDNDFHISEMQLNCQCTVVSSGLI